MNKKIFVKLLLTALAVGSVTATETRTPLPGLQGPLRYEFEKLEKNKWGFNFWSTAYQREADKAFMKHGTNTEPYTALIFGKSEFKIAEAFQDGHDSTYYTEYRNPHLDSATVAPRASYTERGMVVGASLVYPVWKNDGHIGLRASLPFRNVRVEKDDEIEHSVVGLQDKVIKGGARFVSPETIKDVPAGGVPADTMDAAADATAIFTQTNGNVPAANAAAINKSITNISSYNLKYLSTIKTLEAGKLSSLFDYVKNVAGIDGSGGNNARHAGNTDNKVGLILIKSANNKTLPYDRGGALLVQVSKNGAHGVSTVVDAASMLVPAEISVSRIAYVEGASTVKVNVTAAPVNTDLSGANAAKYNSNMTLANNTEFTGAGEGTARVLDKQTGGGAITYDITKIPDTLWVTTVHGSTGNPIDTSVAAVNFLDNALLIYNQNATSFLSDRGYAFQTYQQTGIGDADLDLFYQHSLSDNWTGEIYTGVRLPTGACTKYVGNPYKMNLGNGGHFEVKVGGKLGWAMFKNIDVKADASYSFVLQAKEHRMAAFSGATVKNIGPQADADVDWGYFKGDFDVTLYHPKTHDLSTTFGYELYYKTEDKVSFKNAKTSDHFLGKVWGTAADTPATSTTAGNNFYDYNWNLSNAVARKNTESVAHRGYVEGHYDFSKYLSMYVGGKYTFAGQNIPRESEAYGGLNVKF